MKGYEEKKVFLGGLGDDLTLCIWILNYSGTNTNFKGSTGNSFGLNSLNEDKLNLVKVGSDSTTNSGFSISINYPNKTFQADSTSPLANKSFASWWLLASLAIPSGISSTLPKRPKSFPDKMVLFLIAVGI